MRRLLILSLNTAQIKCTSLFLNFLHLQPRPSTFNQHFQTYLLRNIHLLCFALLGLAWLSFAFLCFRFPPVRAEDLLKSVVQHYNITALACRHFFCEIWSSRAEEWNSSLTTLRCVALRAIEIASDTEGEAAGRGPWRSSATAGAML